MIPRPAVSVPRLLAALALPGILAAASGCTLGLPDGVVLRLDGQDWRHEDFDRHVTEVLGPEGPGLGSDVLSRLFERFVDDQLLLRWARDHDLVDADATAADAAAAIIESASLEVTADDVEARYADRRAEYRRPDRARLRQILLEDRAATDLALAELQAGAVFADVARRHSVGPSAATGGLQGDLSRQDLPDSLGDLVFGLAEGEWSELQATDHGFRLFQVERFLPEETLPLDAVAASIRERLSAERAEDLLRDTVERARREYNPRVAVAGLPFSYRGRYAPGAVE